ncbi:SIS domain-containing protein [soil metagenome]
MSALTYLRAAGELVGRIESSQSEALTQAAGLMADGVARGGMVSLFGSGHSILPVMDAFPRYGSYPALRPLTDIRLSWFNVLGTGGVRELLWLERTEGYIGTFLDNYPFRDGDSLVVYSHGGLNAAGIEAAMYARERSVPVVAVTSVANLDVNPARHSSGKRLAEVADVVIDNCCVPEDAVVDIEGWGPPVGATSTLAAVVITMALVAELAQALARRGVVLPTFVSPNDTRFGPDHNAGVFEDYRERTRR